MAPLIPQEDQDWLLDALAYLVQRRGADSLVSNPVLEPTDRFFPDHWEPNERGVVVLAKRLLIYAGLESLDARVSTFSQPDEVRELNEFGRAKSPLFVGFRGDEIPCRYELMPGRGGDEALAAAA